MTVCTTPNSTPRGPRAKAPPQPPWRGLAELWQFPRSLQQAKVLPVDAELLQVVKDEAERGRCSHPSTSSCPPPGAPMAQAHLIVKDDGQRRKLRVVYDFSRQAIGLELPLNQRILEAYESHKQRNGRSRGETSKNRTTTVRAGWSLGRCRGPTGAPGSKPGRTRDGGTSRMEARASPGPHIRRLLPAGHPDPSLEGGGLERSLPRRLHGVPEILIGKRHRDLMWILLGGDPVSGQPLFTRANYAAFGVCISPDKYQTLSALAFTLLRAAHPSLAGTFFLDDIPMACPGRLAVVSLLRIAASIECWLRLPWGWRRTFPSDGVAFSSTFTALGAEVRLAEGTGGTYQASASNRSKQRIRLEALLTKNTWKRRELQSVLGGLQFLTSFAPRARPWLAAGHGLLAEMERLDKPQLRVPADHRARQHLRQFRIHIDKMGPLPLAHSRETWVVSDATPGICAWLSPVGTGIAPAPGHIVAAELKGFVEAIEAVAPSRRGSIMHAFCDNAACVAFVGGSSPRD